MKRALMALVAASLLGVIAGCVDGPAGNACYNGDPQAAACPPQGHCPVHGPACGGRCGLGHGGGEAYNPGPPVGQVTYPYYTVRGPRDFLQRTPSPIGP